ncbi:hypothetical protein PFISCL1PPCAC_10372, partial [Pristionchus fissidentatus]
SAHDDFFGIEYIQSTSQSNENRKDEGSQEKREVKRYSIEERRELSEMESKKMSGTEFMDAAFFPEVRERKEEIGEWSKGEEGTKSIWEEQYFQRREGYCRQNRIERRIWYCRNDDRSMVVEERSEKRPKKEKEHSGGEDERVPSGLESIRSQSFPVWKMNENQLVDALCERVVYNDGEIFAIDKPMGLAYSGGKESGKLRLCGLAARVKDRLLPKCERLHPVLSLEKAYSGITLFTTFILAIKVYCISFSNRLLQSELVERMKHGEITIKTECIVRGAPRTDRFFIEAPLIKSTKEGQIKLYAARKDDARGMGATTGVKKIRGNEAHSHVELETRSEIAHQLRAHLALSGTPLIGDGVYGGKKGAPMRYPSQILSSLSLTRNQSTRLPMFIHRREISIPSIISTKPGISIIAPLPPHFTLLLKKLSLLKKMK